MLDDFAPDMFPHTVQFCAGAYPVGIRGGVKPSYEPGPAVAAYVETTTGAAMRGENPFQKPQSKTSYRVFVQVDPSKGLARALHVNDQVLWVDTNMIFQALEEPQYQAPLWLVQCERIA